MKVRWLMPIVLAAILLLAGACSAPPAAPPTAPAAASRSVFLVANEWSEDMKLMLTDEVGVMKDMLEKAGYKVSGVGRARREA